MDIKSNPAAFTALEISCAALVSDTGRLNFRYSLKNVSPQAIHIFDSPRMPYLLLVADKSLLILHGVNPPKPGASYYGIEIPITRAIEPDQVVDYEVSLTPLYLKDHYETHRTPTDLHGPVTLQAQAGWGETPILSSERHKLSIHDLLAWQHLAECDPIQVDLP